MKTWVEISRSALQHNVQALKRSAAPAQLIAVLKSNAYGHGLTEVARVVSGAAAWIGVDSVEEGVALRAAGVKKSLLVIGYVPKDQLLTCIAKRLSFVVHNIESLKYLARLKKGSGAFRIHLPIETGTTREGFSLEELPGVARLIQKMPSVRLEGAYMHFANVEDVKRPAYAKKQLHAYERALLLMQDLGLDPGLRHTASSAAVFVSPEAQFDLVRPGIALYGLWPSEQVKRHSKGLSLHPVLTWKTIVAQVKDVAKGTSVGYDRTERVRRDSKVAVLPVGYWDGLDRRLSSKGHVLIRGKRCKILGRICMNMCMVDVTGVSGVAPNDEVVIIGKQGREEVSAEEFAKTLGTINYEVVTRINPQIPRKLVK